MRLLAFITFSSLLGHGLGESNKLVTHRSEYAARTLNGYMPAEDLTITMHISLRLPEDGVQSAARHLHDISNPSSPNFGQHWSAQKVARHFAPRATVVQNIRSWLKTSGISRIKLSHDQSHLSFVTTISNAEKLLATKYFYVNDMEGVSKKTLGVVEYSLPADIDDKVIYIHPTFPLPIDQNSHSDSKPVDLAAVKRQKPHVRRQFIRPQSRVNNTTTIDCTKQVTPECLRLIYNIPQSGNDDEIHPNSTFGLYHMSFKTWLPDDLDMFFGEVAPSLVGQRPKLQAISGGYQQTDYKGLVYNAEPNLDFEYAIALTHPQPVTNIQVGDFKGIGLTSNMLAAYDELYCGALDPVYDPKFSNETIMDCGTFDPPKVISISYTWNEESFPDAYLQRQCLEYGKFLANPTLLCGR